MNPSNSPEPLTSSTARALMQFKNKEPYLVNISRSIREGGTGLYNFNATEQDGQAVLVVLRELKCDCLFVVPLPCFGVYPWDGLSPAHTAEQFEAGLQTREMHNCLCVHQYPGASSECRQLFRQLMIQEITTRNPENVPPEVELSGIIELARIMNLKNKR